MSLKLGILKSRYPFLLLLMLLVYLFQYLDGASAAYTVFSEEWKTYSLGVNTNMFTIK